MCNGAFYNVPLLLKSKGNGACAVIAQNTNATIIFFWKAKNEEK
jgi:hypothetical protein